jgi:hypothetical protein
MVAPRHLIMLACSALGLTGCAASLQDLHYSVVNKTRAEYAWYTNTSSGQRWNYGSDYAHGYKAGYYDASTGKGCSLPPVPPPCYWSTKYQCCEGQKHIQDWYRGYQCGATDAQGSGYPYFHSIPIGPQAPIINKDGCGACYAPTGCLCENGLVDQISGDEFSIGGSISSTGNAQDSHGGVDAGANLPPTAIVQTSAMGLIGPVGPALSLSDSPGTQAVRTTSMEVTKTQHIR